MKMEETKSEIDIVSESESESSSEEDEYEANIEFSNACRNYYLSRLEATETFKKDLKREDEDQIIVPKNTKKRSNSIDDKMEKLRTEMASLMDQDVSLMQQLLTLNETINELKQGRYAASSKGSVSSRGFVGSSEWSIASDMGNISLPHIPGFTVNSSTNGNSGDKMKSNTVLNNDNNNNDSEKINPSELWKVRTQFSLTSNDSGFAEETAFPLQTEV